MIHRRALLSSVAALTIATALPLPAQHADLEPGAEADAQPLQRRYLMEDVYGNVVTNEDMQGRFLLIYFGYTGCPDVCPTSMSTLADVMESMGEQIDQLAVLFVTVDPDRDTAKVLRDYVGFFDKRIIALRGPKPYTDHMVKTFNARYEIHVSDPEDPQNYSVDHTASIAFMGPDGVLIRRFPHGISADAMASDIKATIAMVPAN